MKITKKFRQAIKSGQLKMRLCLELGITQDSLYRWLLYDNEKFAHLKVIKAVTKLTGLTQEEMFEEEEVTENA